MRVTVAICTWNRCELLRQTLEEMTSLTIPPGVDWELLVADNNSTDATADVIAAFATRLPIRRLFEPTPGQTHARNHIIRETRGDYILWTDDDGLVASDWLVEYCRAFARWPDAAVFGGTVEPWFPVQPPPWLLAVWHRVSTAYAVLDLGSEMRPLVPMREGPFGVNMALRTDIQRRFLFDPELGLRPGRTLRGDESAVVQQMFEAGESGVWVPTARVRHYIPADRHTRRYLEGYYYGHGAQTTRNWIDPGGPMLFGRPRWFWTRAVTTELKYRFRLLTSKPEVWINDLIAANMARGALTGYRRPV